MDQKKALQSKTVWLNLVMGVLVALVPLVPAAQPFADWLKDPAHLAIVGSVWSIAGIVLRFITKDKIVLGD